MDADDYQITLELLDVPASEAGDLAAELREFILDEDPQLSVKSRKADPETQDFGTTLVVIVTVLAPAVAAVARGVAKWLEKRASASVVVTDGTRRIEVKNISSRSAKKLAEEIAQSFGPAAGTS